MLEWETPTLVSELVEAFPEAWGYMAESDEHAYCSECGKDSQRRRLDELWAVRHRHSSFVLGSLNLYCAEHLPRREWQQGPGARGSRVSEELCPEHFLYTPVGPPCTHCGRPTPHAAA